VYESWNRQEVLTNSGYAVGMERSACEECLLSRGKNNQLEKAVLHEEIVTVEGKEDLESIDKISYAEWFPYNGKRMDIEGSS
jgi:hypothetical protein